MKIYLALVGISFFGYGLYCLAVPGALAEVAGVVGSTPTGTTELRAMYGGLQIGAGLLAGMALVRPGLVRPAIVSLAFLLLGLFSARALGSILDGSLSSYTISGLCFELGAGAIAAWLSTRLEPV